jgi:hypothetical protein
VINFIINFLESSSDTIFWASAIVGTTFFLLRISMSIFGGGFSEDDIDFDDLHDGDGHHRDGHHPDGHHSSSLFKFLTMHSLSGFCMMFGWSGLACTQQFHMTSAQAFLIALMCGVSMLVVTALIMRGALYLQGPGSVFSINKTIGMVGTVYQRIPADGLGKIHATVNNNTRELLAQSHNKKAIESFTLIKVVSVIDHEIVEVIELTSELPKESL